MQTRICSICDAINESGHKCADYLVSKISIEMELLDLTFTLEPYEDDNSSSFSHYTGNRSNTASYVREDSFKSKPMFLRM